MIGRGTRTIPSTDLRAVTPDVVDKTHFIVVDAVGVTESVKIDSRPLEHKPTVPFDKLIQSIAMGARDQESLTSLAGRLARLNVQLEPQQQNDLSQLADGKDLIQIINTLMDATDPDRIIQSAKAQFATENPSVEQLHHAYDRLSLEACEVFDNPQFRERLIDLKRQHEQVIDVISQDTVLETGFDTNATEHAKAVVEQFRAFLTKAKDEILALQIIYNQPYSKRHLTYEMIRDLAESMQNPPYNLDTDRVWQAFEQLDKDRVHKRSPHKLLTDVIALVRYGLGKTDRLNPFTEIIEQRFADWMSNQKKAGNVFTPEQREWLTMIKEHVAASAEITTDDFDEVPFNNKGGLSKVYTLFGERLNPILNELNEVLTA
jgi:type I restriction enzyme R subunit